MVPASCWVRLAWICWSSFHLLTGITIVCYFHTVEISITLFSHCENHKRSWNQVMYCMPRLRFERTCSKIKRNVNKRKISIFDVEFEIYFTRETILFEILINKNMYIARTNHIRQWTANYMLTDYCQLLIAYCQLSTVVAYCKLLSHFCECVNFKMYSGIKRYNFGMVKSLFISLFV